MDFIIGFLGTIFIVLPSYLIILIIYKIKGIAEVNATKYTKAVKFCRLYLNINRIKVKIDLILHNCAANLSDNKCGHQEAPQNGRMV